MSTPKNLPPSCAKLTAQLIVEGCLPMIQGTMKTEMPIEALPLTEEERARLNLRPGSITVFYPAGQEGVFYDIWENEFSIWFNGDDTDKATTALHDALTRAFPTTKQLDDVPDRKNSKMRARVYRVDLGAGRFAAISTSFSLLKNGKHSFAARVIAQQRPN